LLDLTFDLRAPEGQPANLVVEPHVDGDYNRNRTVDAADYVVWRNTLFTNVAEFSAADGNGTGNVDVGDYSVWRANFGARLPAGSAAALTAPEPSAWSSLTAGALAMMVALAGRRPPRVCIVPLDSRNLQTP
jgi:hypothetical protein